VSFGAQTTGGVLLCQAPRTFAGVGVVLSDTIKRKGIAGLNVGLRSANPARQRGHVRKQETMRLLSRDPRGGKVWEALDREIGKPGRIAAM